MRILRQKIALQCSTKMSRFIICGMWATLYHKNQKFSNLSVTKKGECLIDFFFYRVPSLIDITTTELRLFLSSILTLFTTAIGVVTMTIVYI